MITHRVAIAHELDLDVLYPNAEIIDGDNLVIKDVLLHPQNAVAVYRTSVPSQETFKRSRIPIVVFMRKRIRPWMKNVAKVTDGRPNLFQEGNRWVSGEIILKSSVPPIMLWSLIKQNAYMLWPSGIPQIVFDMDDIVSRYQTDYFYDLLSILRPEAFIGLKWRRKKKEDN